MWCLTDEEEKRNQRNRKVSIGCGVAYAIIAMQWLCPTWNR